MNEATGSRSIYEALVQRPVATIMGFLAAVVFGFVSYQSLPLNLMPDLDYPTLTVRTEYPGAAPGEVESQVSRQIEESLSTVPGLASLESVSRAGVSDVVLEFDWDSDMTDLSQAVRERLALLDMGDEVSRPLVLRYDPELDPMLRIAIGGEGSGEAALVALRRLAEDEIKRAVETLPGVAAVKVLGGLEREITVEANEGLLAARGFTVEQLAARLQQENINLAGGSLLEGQTEYLIRTLNEFRDASEIEDLYLFGEGGRSARIGELAVVRQRTKEREVVGRLGGAEAVEIAVFREADANIVDVSRRVQDAIFGTDAQRAWIEQRDAERAKAAEEAKKATEAGEAAGGKGAKGAKAGEARGAKGKGGKAKDGKSKRKRRPSKRNPGGGMGGGRGGGDNAMLEKQMTAFLAYSLPEGTTLTVVSDQARFIESAIDDVRSTALVGALLAIVVLFVFLRHGWSTFLVGVAIPISVIVTFAPMYLFGVSLNLMSLGGMALCIGMLVDNSIVVLESVVRCQEEGDPPLQAAIRGASEVAGAVLASTLTTVAVFFPIAFVSGVAGQLFGHLALTVVFGLLASLAVALFLVPVLAALPAKIALSRAGAADPTSPGTGVRFEPAPRAFLRAIGSDLRGLPAFVRGDRWFGLPLRLVGALLLLALALVRALALFPFMVLLWMGFALARLAGRGFGWAWGLRRHLGGGGGDALDRVGGGLGDLYEAGMFKALRRPSLVLVPALLLFVGALRFGAGLGSELLPEVHQGVFLARVALPVGSPLDRTLELVSRLEKGVARIDGIQSVYTSAGAEQDLGSSSDKGTNTAEMTIRLTPSDDPEASEERTREAVRAYIEGEYDGVELELTAPTLFSLRTPLEVEVRGNDLELMKDAADRAVKRLETVPGLRDVRSNLQSGYPEIQIRYDRDRLSRYGLDVGTVARAVRNKVQGNVATFLRGGNTKTDIRVVLREGDRETADDLAALNVNPAGTPAIRLDSVADLLRATGPSEIRRSDQERAALIGADLIGFDLGTAAVDVEQALREVPTGRDVRFEVGGQSREMESSLGSLRFALLLAVFLVYIIMASQFESIVQPLVILFALPLAVVGVVPALALFDVSVSVIVLIGGIVLAGVVVNNAIVLVDYANQLRIKGMSATEAIVTAGRVRMRPIIISTLTTVLGLMPMVVGMGDGSEIRRPLALTIIAGLSSSTLLTLGVIPVLYHLVVGRTRVPRPNELAETSTPPAPPAGEPGEVHA